MKEALARQSRYALGHSEQELDRLSRQAEIFEPFTRQLLQQAGISRGMRVLDVGCGSGDVTLLASEQVGPSGKVIGADQAISAVRRAAGRARARQIGNVQFFEGDPTEMQFDRPFDASSVDSFLMYYPNPVDAIRKLAGRVRDGGVFVDAGLPGPSMRMDALIGGRPDCPAVELTAEVTRSLLPAMEKLKIATARDGIAVREVRARPS
jgi:SAM-dependent methyltransferase